jgi:hypothetical protein
MDLRLVDSTVACVTLHRSARDRGYKLSREGTDPESLWRCVLTVINYHYKSSAKHIKRIKNMIPTLE